MKQLTLIITFSLLLLSQAQLCAQVVIGRLVHGGNRLEIIKIYSNKSDLTKARKEKVAGNENVEFYLFTPNSLKKITNYINANCKSSSSTLKANDDVYLIVIGKNKTGFKLNDKDGKSFLARLNNWLKKSSLSKECDRLTVSLQRNLIDSLD
jgi:hypothetical protein